MAYSVFKTSDGGPSEIGTDLSKRDTARVFALPIVQYIYNLLEEDSLLKEDNLSTKDKTSEFILYPTRPLLRGSMASNKCNPLALIFKSSISKHMCV